MRPRLTEKELELINYSLLILEQLCENKLKEQLSLPSDLKRFARIVWYTGDPRAFEIFKPYKEYVLAERGKIKSMGTLKMNASVLKRRIEGLLNGRKFHSREFIM